MKLPRFITGLLFLISLFVSGVSFSQTKYADSLKQLLTKKDLADTSRMEIMINIADALKMDYPALARQEDLAVYKLAERSDNPYYKARAFSGLGKLFDATQYDSALYYYRLADSLYALDPSQPSRESRATNKADIALIYEGQSQFEQAIQTYLDAISIMENSKDKQKWLILGILYSNIGGVYQDLKQFPKVLEYDLKSLDAYKKSNADPYYIVAFELYVASDYKNLDQLDQARLHIEAAEKISKQLNSNDLLYKVYNAWGGYYQKAKDYGNGIQSYQAAMTYAVKNDDMFKIMNCNRMLGMIYRDMKNYPQSLNYMQTALTQVRQLKNKMLEVELLKNLGLVQSKLGNDKEAVDYYKNYIDLSDSLNQESTKQKINEIENKYQSRKKQDSILTLSKSYQLQKSELNQKRTINIALISGCVLLLMLAGVSYKNFKNKNQLLVQSEKFHAQQISELEKEKKLLAAQSLMRGQEEERSRLARDLHDGVGGLLSGVKLGMSGMKGNVYLSEEHAHSFEKVIRQLDQSIAELRRVSHNMMPEALMKYGLKEALENYCESLNVSGQINVQLQTYGAVDKIEKSVEIVIYRIVQELLTNVIRHASANKALIQLVFEGNRFNLTVEDDGKGFDVNEYSSGAGLANIKARVDYLNGNIDIDSKKGDGTSVHIEGDCL
jgi:two-component system NarL family sensor kinase